jgi:hypothetical protein
LDSVESQWQAYAHGAFTQSGSNPGAHQSKGKSSRARTDPVVGIIGHDGWLRSMDIKDMELGGMKDVMQGLVTFYYSKLLIIFTVSC